MTLDKINRLLTRGRLFAAATKAKANCIAFGESVIMPSEPCRRICLHLNDDGSAVLTFHQNLKSIAVEIK